MFIRQYGDRFRIDTPAKVNFFLELKGRREDGFHQIDTAMQTVSLWDSLDFAPTQGQNIRLSCQLRHPTGQPGEQDPIPTDDRNLVVRACERLRRFAIDNQIKSPLPLSGLKIRLTKWIPSAAGLGGASSDCAAALVGANRIWGLGLNQQQLHSIAAELGSDVPFFLYGGACRCTGRGEIIQTVPATAGVNLVIVKPPVALSTKDVFGQVCYASANSTVKDTNLAELPAPVDAAVQSIATGRPQQIAGSLFNRLANAATQLTGQLQRVASLFERVGSLGHQMSGSGSSHFGIFANRKSARIARQQMASQLGDCRVFAVRTLAAPVFAPIPLVVAGRNISLAEEGASR